MSGTRWVCGLLVAAAMLCGSTVCRADGFIIIHEPPVRVTPWHFVFAPLEVSYHHVTVEVNDQVAVTSVDEEFYNPNNARLEGTYVFPLPAGAHIDKFSMDINGKLMDAELLPADKARALYEDIVRKFRDPALLEYAGRDAFRVHIFPIEPNSRKHVKLSYTQVLGSDTGLVEYTYPLNTEKFSARPLNDVSVRLTLNTKDPIKSVYSPTHNVQTQRDGDRKTTVSYGQKDVRPDTDFKLIFSRSKSPVGVDLLTYRNNPEDGYFLLMASPGIDAAAGQVQKKDICFVLDTSGSMSGPKIEQARKALSFCLSNLNEGDRFEVIRFSTESESLFNELKPAEKANVDKALSFVKDLKAIGGTAIEDATKKALSLPHAADRPFVVIFLTDGQPTIGETNEDALVTSVTKASNGNVKLFSFGIGNDVNTHLLDRFAEATHAFSQYVLADEDIEVKLSNFYTKIREPVLSNVTVTFNGAQIKTGQVYPAHMPDLFKGETLMVFGRYTGPGAAAVKITGTLNGQAKEFVTDVKFAENDTANSFIPKLWATRRVGWLLDEIRLHGENAELKDEVVKLSREHGIVTPYTAYLILEDEQRRNVPVALQNFRELGNDGIARRRLELGAGEFDRESKDESLRSGDKAIGRARDVRGLKEQATAGSEAPPASSPGALAKGGALFGTPRQPASPAAPQSDVAGYRSTRSYAQQARVLGGRAFYQNDGVWTDSTAQGKAGLPQKQIKFGSDDYFALLKAHPEATSWLSLGDQMDVVLDNTLIQIRPQ